MAKNHNDTENLNVLMYGISESLMGSRKEKSNGD